VQIWLQTEKQRMFVPRLRREVQARDIAKAYCKWLKSSFNLGARKRHGATAGNSRQSEGRSPVRTLNRHRLPDLGARAEKDLVAIGAKSPYRSLTSGQNV
jgi:hypothetical protein